ncbi:MAG: hypothetical protein L3J91_05650, partial [Thermoplasmata archaeon]|nr:hypothetical protein [Thermoplasmata archaeon]
MPPRWLGGASLAILLVLVLLLTAAPPTGSPRPGPAMAFASLVGSSTSAPSARTHAPLAVSTASLAVGGRVFSEQSSLPYGSTNSVTGLAVDPASGTVFAANEFAGTITTFSETTGVVEQSQPIASFAQGSFPSGILLDAGHQRLFVSISTRFSTPGAGGWVLVLNESTLTTEANLTFAAPPTTPFEPTFLALDASTDQLFVENATHGEVAFIDLATGSVTKYLLCPVVLCAEHPYG